MNPNIKCTCPFGNPLIAVASDCPVHKSGSQSFDTHPTPSSPSSSGKEAIDMAAQEWFEKGSIFTLDFLDPAERETIYKIMDLFAQGKIRFHAASLLKENGELKEENTSNLKVAEDYKNQLEKSLSSNEAKDKEWELQCKLKEEYMKKYSDSQKSNEYWKQLAETNYDKGYGDGYNEASREAAKEIRENYRPNNEQ